MWKKLFLTLTLKEQFWHFLTKSKLKKVECRNRDVNSKRKIHKIVANFITFTVFCHTIKKRIRHHKWHWEVAKFLNYFARSIARVLTNGTYFTMGWNLFFCRKFFGGIFWEKFWKDLLGGFFLEDFFWRIFLGGFFGGLSLEEFFV